MIKKNILLAKMNKKTSRNGNIYFVGKPEKDMRYVLLKNSRKNEHGEETWHLLLSDH